VPILRLINYSVELKNWALIIRGIQI